MKKVFFFMVALLISGAAWSQINFDDYFLSKTLRLDYVQAGKSDTALFYFAQLKEEEFWGGSKKNLIDTLAYGLYQLKVFDLASKQVIYSRGFNSLFEEWQISGEAKTMQRGMYEVVTMPYPKNKIKVEVTKGNRQGGKYLIFTKEIDPKSYFIIKEKSAYKAEKVSYKGDPAKKVDLVFLPEGYTQAEMGKFAKDVERITKKLFETSPFKDYQNDFNIWRVDVPSQESGCDVPGEGTWKNTLFSSSFYTFDIARYVMITDNKLIRDYAGLAPYDQICILINSSRYGGGGVFNYYSLSTVDNERSEQVFVHEFGHGFVGLGDEYSTTDEANQNSYNSKNEPYEPNLTTMVNFGKKWKPMVKKTTPIPTPADGKYDTEVGAFEGAGYLQKGVYRPFRECKMKALKDDFCPVCKKAIIEMIQFYKD